MKKLRVIAATAVICSLGLVGCQNSDSGSSSSSKDGDKPTVITTFTVLADMAKNVAGDHLNVVSITTPGAEIHDYQPKPADIKKAADADLIINNGLGLERWFKRFVADSKASTVDVSKGVTPMPIADGPEKNEPNPHAWMSPKNGEIYVDNMEKAFAKIDPKHADDYKANAEKYKQKIENISKTMTDELESLPKSQRVLVTCEGAFSYLARDTGMTEKYLWAVNAEGALKPQQVSDVEAYVKENKVPAVFCESTVGDKMKPVVEATGAKFGGILYVDSLSGPKGDVPTYLDLLSYDAKTITSALTGSGK